MSLDITDDPAGLRRLTEEQAVAHWPDLAAAFGVPPGPSLQLACQRADKARQALRGLGDRPASLQLDPGAAPPAEPGLLIRELWQVARRAGRVTEGLAQRAGG